MTSLELYEKFNILLNSNHSFQNVRVEKPVFVSLFNREKDRWFAQSIGEYGDNDRIFDLQSHYISSVKLEEFSNHPISTLSGGQFQRMLIARCLIQEQDILFLDEPFVGIDLVSEQIIMNLLQSLRREGKTIVIVHHDLSKVSDYFDKVVILNKKWVSYGDVATSFTPDALKKAYGDSIVVL